MPAYELVRNRVYLVREFEFSHSIWRHQGKCESISLLLLVRCNRSMWKALRSTTNSNQTRGISIVVGPDTDNQFQGSFQSRSTIYRAGIVLFSALNFSLVLYGEKFSFICLFYACVDLVKWKLSTSKRLNAFIEYYFSIDYKFRTHLLIYKIYAYIRVFLMCT